MLAVASNNKKPDTDQQTTKGNFLRLQKNRMLKATRRKNYYVQTEQGKDAFAQVTKKHSLKSRKLRNLEGRTCGY